MSIRERVDQRAPATSVAGAAGDSLAVAAWTLISRITGFVKVAAIGAVLGPTFLGNAYQFTNTLPNLIYFGFLAGSLFSSLLVPALVGHIDTNDRASAERVAGGFLGVTLLALAAITGPAIVLGPELLTLATGGGAQSGAQQHIARLLIVMFVPQLFFYGVVGTASAAQNARQKFALAAAAPAVENIGTVAVLVACAVLFGTNTTVAATPTAETAILGLGSTAAVALHAAVQWWGARRCGIRLVPRAGWRDAEVRTVLRRAVPSLAQAGLLAVQVLTLLTLANRVAGGVVAVQIALNFYYLAIAVGATPVALSLLPRLARMHAAGDVDGFRATLADGYRLGLFLAVPTAVGYLALATPAARAVSFGRMTAGGTALIAAALAALALAVVGQTIFAISSYASYARKDTRTPLRAMAVQCVICVGLAGFSLLAHGSAVTATLGLALSAAVTASGAQLALAVRRRVGGAGVAMAPSLLKSVASALLMIGPAWLAQRAVAAAWNTPDGYRVGLLAGAATGLTIFLAAQAALRSPELAALRSGLQAMRRRPLPAPAVSGG